MAVVENMMTIAQAELEEVLRLLSRSEGLGHLRVKKRAQSITIWSGDKADEQQHARLTRLGRATWGLSFPHHSGRWEKTPFVGSMEEVVTTLMSDFSFHLDAW